MGVLRTLVMLYSRTRSPQQTALIFGCTVTTFLALLSFALALFSQPTAPLPLMAGCFILLLIIWSPTTILNLHRTWNQLLRGIGHTLILLYWFLYVLPSGLLLQARGFDPLKRRFEPETPTYWQKPLPPTDMRKLS